MEKEHVLDMLVAEASKEEGMVRHRSVHALAVEAVWLWRKGGGRRPAREELDRREVMEAVR